MIWIAPSEKTPPRATLEKRLWDTADQFRANSGLKAQEYSGPILGLIFLRFAEVRFAAQRAKLESPSPVASRHPLPSDGRGAGGEGAASVSRRGSRVDEPAAYHAEGILYLARQRPVRLPAESPEAKDIGAKVNDAMRDIEKHNPQLAGVLPKTYNLFTSTLLKELLKKVSEIPATVDYDAFGRILDPACGSGGMFVSSARFVSEHKKNPSAEISIHGVEKTDETGRLCRMNLAVHGLESDIRHGGQVNSYYDDPHKATGQFDFVLAKPTTTSAAGGSARSRPG